MFVIYQDIDLWDIITKGPKVPMKMDSNKIMFKSQNSININKVIWKSCPRTI